jgi:AmmeMemoRadiSam system protein B
VDDSADAGAGDGGAAPAETAGSGAATVVDRPRIRPIEAQPIRAEGTEMIALKDPSGLAPDPILVSPGAFVLITMMDGSSTLLDLQAEFCRRTGHILPSSEVEVLVSELDERLFLDSDRFAHHVKALTDDFRHSPVRAAHLAGKCYATDPDSLRDQLGGYFTAEGGPGGEPPQHARARGARAASGARARGAIIPHIDPPRGGTTYAHAYRALVDTGPPPPLAIVLGTSHQPTGTGLTFTRKDYETPLGPLRTDCALLDRLERSFGERLYAGEFMHRNEHSVEFQILFLRYMWEGHDIPVLPVLCGSLHEILSAGKSPEDDPLYRDLATALREIVLERRALVIASADLAHVGPQFGDPAPYEEPLRRRLEQEDREMLAPVLALDRLGFHERVWAAGDRNRICGFTPIYTLLALLEPELAGAGSADLLQYRQWPDPRAVVTFASVVFRSAPASPSGSLGDPG